MTLSTLFILASSAILGVLCFSVGFVSGTLSRLFFRYQFKEWVTYETDEMQRTISQSVSKAEEQARQAVSAAHVQTQAIYKAAAEHVAEVKLPEMTSKLN